MARVKHTDDPVGPRVMRERRSAELHSERHALKLRQEELMEWLGAHRDSAEWEDTYRALHLVTGRIEALSTRISNIRLGEPELGLPDGQTIRNHATNPPPLK